MFSGMSPDEIKAELDSVERSTEIAANAHIAENKDFEAAIEKVKKSERSQYIVENGYLDKIKDGRDLAFVIELLPDKERADFIESHGLASRIKKPLPVEGEHPHKENPSEIIKLLPKEARVGFVISQQLTEDVTYSEFANIMKEIPEDQLVDFISRSGLKRIKLLIGGEDHDLNKVVELIPKALQWSFINTGTFRNRITSATGLARILRLIPEGKRVSYVIDRMFFDKINDESVLDRGVIDQELTAVEQADFWKQYKEWKLKKSFEDTIYLFRTQSESKTDSFEQAAAKNKFINALEDLKKKTITDFELENITAEDALLIAKEAETLVKSISTQVITDPQVLFNSIKTFRDKTAPFKGASWSWLTILEAVIGAAIGVAMGIALTLVTGPVAVIIAASVIGVVGAACGAGHSLWRIRAEEPLSKTADTAEQVVSLRA